MRERRASPPAPARWSRVNQTPAWSHPVVYPDNGAARVTVNFEDLERLDEGEFLNDNLVQFAIRHVEENMPAEHRDSVHFFNTFFFSALTHGSGRKSINYDKVRRWTKNKDLFSFPYVVVPININLHWFVAIICNLPNLSREKIALESASPVGDDPPSSSIPQTVQPILSDPERLLQAQSETSQRLSNLSLSDNGVENVGDDGRENKENDKGRARWTESLSGEAPTVYSKSKRSIVTFRPDAPSILTVDSFGSSHARDVRVLKEYLKAEADDKRGMTIEIQELQGVTAKGVPEQTNLCDCGVFLVEYVERFAQDPQRFASRILTREMNKESDFANFDPSRKRADIRNLLLDLAAAQEGERKAKKAAKKEKAKIASAIERPEHSVRVRVPSPQKEAPLFQRSSQEGLNSRAQGRSLEETPLDEAHGSVWNSISHLSRRPQDVITGTPNNNEERSDEEMLDSSHSAHHGMLHPSRREIPRASAPNERLLSTLDAMMERVEPGSQFERHIESQARIEGDRISESPEFAQPRGL